MNLVIDFDDEVLKRYDSRRSTLLFYIHWQHNNECFPEKNWMDFGGTLLGWWSMALCRMAKGSAAEELLFMDGPFALKLSKNADGDRIRVRVRDYSFECEETLLGLAREVSSAVDCVLAKTLKANVGAKDRENLCAAKDLLRETFGFETT